MFTNTHKRSSYNTMDSFPLDAPTIPISFKAKAKLPVTKHSHADLWKLISIYEKECCLVERESEEGGYGTKGCIQWGMKADRHQDFFLEGRNFPSQGGPVHNKYLLLSHPQVRASTSPKQGSHLLSGPRRLICRTKT